MPSAEKGFTLHEKKGIPDFVRGCTLFRGCLYEALFLEKTSLKESEQPQLVEQDDGNSHGGKVTEDEDDKTQIGYAQSAVVGNLVAHKLFVEIPARKDGDEHAAYGEEDVGRDVIEQVKDAHAKQLDSI